MKRIEMTALACAAAFVLLAILRICGIVKISWWLVTLPLWLPTAAVALIAISMIAMIAYQSRKEAKQKEGGDYEH